MDEIIADKDVLEEDYIPLYIPCRDSQKKELAFVLSPVENGRRPFDCLCYGMPGTGKTLLVKYVLQQLNENTGAFTFYVNCWKNRTLNQVLDEMLKQVQIPIVEANSSVKIDGLKRKIGRKVCVIALDEIDKLDNKELNDILYLLKGIGKAGLICISNTRKYLLNLDPRVNSRLSFHSINFPPYSIEELMMILKHRIIDCKALYPNTYSEKVLEKIADLSAGDARIAIQTLRNASLIAERNNRRKITLEDVKKGYEKVKYIKRKYLLDKLGSHYRLIYEIAKNNPGITSKKFYEKYKQEARRQGLNPKSNRMFNNYIYFLMRLGYLQAERVKTKGNVRSFTVIC